jgi:ubiquinol-cytochrome c reductase cytochrome c subunit
MLRRSLARGGVLLVLVAAGVVGATRSEVAAQQPADEVPPQEELDLGTRLYGRDCVSCHGPRGEGSFRGPPLEGVGAASAHFWLTTGYMPITRRDDPIRRSPVPYDDQELEALIAHVAGFGEGPAVPEVDVEGADLTLGGRLYRLHCAPCHSATGIGGAMVFDQFAPAVFESTPTQTATAMLIGPGAMPAFPERAFEPEEVAAIAAYVDYLAAPDDPGGLPLLRAGRVDEGFFAWAVGVAALVLLAVWIGQRAGEEGGA